MLDIVNGCSTGSVYIFETTGYFADINISNATYSSLKTAV